MIFLFRLTMALVGLAWVVATLPSETIRAFHSGTRTTIAEGKPVKPEQLDSAIRNYESLASLGYCQPGIQEQLAGFYFNRMAALGPQAAPLEKAGHLKRAEELIRGTLSCSPLEANQWLSLALVTLQRQGISEKMSAYLKMSYLTTPRDYWVVERRLLFASGLAKSFPKSLKAHLESDLNIMRESNRRRAFLRRLKLKTIDEFAKRFETIISPESS